MTSGFGGVIQKRPVLSVVVAFVLGALIIGAVWIATAATPPVDGEPETAPPATEPEETPTAAPPASTDCDDVTTTVTDAVDLQAALDAATPGDVIALAPATYDGHFVISVSGTAERPITLCGAADSILDGGGVDDGYVLHLDHASYWRLTGFTVTNGQKGVMADGTNGSVIDGLTVHTIGDEAIHLRNFSSDNVVSGNKVSDTGFRREKFGEGIYIGTAESNWGDITGGVPDASDRNLVVDNTIWATTAESIDVKEGTSDGVVRGNTFDGSAMTEDGADSWVDIKGNGWLIEGNTGTNSLLDGFQTHEILDGWGTRNVFRGNVANVNGPGFGYSLTPVRDNAVTCDNTASAAGEGLTNTTCSG